MGVMIKDINIKNLGPIPSDINWELGKFNLIYGKNETGKTFLVEFLIRSLFQPKEWKLRPPVGTGKVNVVGLEDSPISFSPSSPHKFDNYYKNKIGGLPPDFSKLLVVKGADVDLAKGETDKVFINRYLSSKEILDTIDDRISKTIQNATIEDNQIIGDRRGEIKAKFELEKKIKNLDDLFQEINQGFLGGERKTLENQLIEAQKTLKEMVKAKRHLAYSLAKQIEDLETKINDLEDKNPEEVEKRFHTWQQKQNDYQVKNEEYKILKEQGKEYSWAKNSTDIYEKYLLKTGSSKPNKPFFIPFFGLIALIIFFAYFNIFLGVAASAVGLSIISYLIIRGYQNIVDEAGKTRELENIHKEFQKRFGLPLSGLSQLKTKLEELKTTFDKSELLKEQLSTDNTILQQLQGQLTQNFKQIFGKKINIFKWEESLQSIKQEKKELDMKIRRLNSKLTTLNVEKDLYLISPASIEYDYDQYAKIKEDVFRLEEQIISIERNLENLKSNISRATGDDINIDWRTLLEHLRRQYNETLKELKSVTAEIIGKRVVMNVVKKFREAEDEKIIKILQSNVISQPLNDVTNRYIGFKIEGDNLYVNDSYNDFKLDDISTGAREQVLLALRMGFCSRILNKDKLFLILDDAFQYSDWKRRQLLVDKVAELANNGWQIIYFTMDDNIKELFDKKGHPFGENYKSYELKDWNENTSTKSSTVII